MLARDHKAVRQQGRDLAKKLGVTPTPPKDDNSAKDHAAVMKKLNGLSGAEFDKAFLQNEVGYHDAVIAAVQSTLMPAIQNARIEGARREGRAGVRRPSRRRKKPAHEDSSG